MTYVAEQMGNSPRMTWDTDAHVFAELRGASNIFAEDAIKQARSKVKRERKKALQRVA